MHNFASSAERSNSKSKNKCKKSDKWPRINEVNITSMLQGLIQCYHLSNASIELLLIKSSTLPGSQKGATN